MTMSYSYVFNPDSFVYYKNTGFVKSVQANLRGENSKNPGISSEVTILAVLPTGNPLVKLNNVTRAIAEKWLRDSLEGGLLVKYKGQIADNIAAEAQQKEDPSPEEELTGVPEELS